MLTLNDGRSELWQWDTGRILAVDADCSQVHFSNKVFGRSIDVDVVNGTAIIPDILLQTDKDLNVWAFVGTAENGYTKISKTLTVNRRNKPADYVFTPPDQTTLAELVGRLDKIEESQAPDAIKNAVDDYLKQNPVEAPVDSVNGKTGAVQLTAADVGAIAYETDPTVPEWAKQPKKPTYTANEVGADPSGTAAGLVSAHNTAESAHNDIRLIISGLTQRLNALADSDDATLDQLSEVVAYIKSNRGLIDAITTSKVSVADIADNLTTNVANKPLSAAQGVVLKALIDGIVIPDKLANPNALTFTGAVSGSYDGSAPLSVEIPSGGGGGGEGTWKHIRKVVIPDDITTDESGVSFSERENGGYYFAFDTDENGEPFEVGDLFVIYSAGSSSDTSYDAMRSPVAFANRNTPSYGSGSPINVKTPIAIGKKTTKTYGWAKCEKIGNYLLASGSYNAGAEFYTLYAARTPVSVSSKFTAINAYLINLASYGFESGSTFDFYGR